MFASEEKFRCYVLSLLDEDFTICGARVIKRSISQILGLGRVDVATPLHQINDAWKDCHKPIK